jgi:hypothetical protein
VHIIDLCFKVPVFNDSVTIATAVLLDASPPPLHCITIESGGLLVWSPDVAVDIELTVSYIYIEGQMHIGSEDCPYTRNTHITLTGKLCVSHRE